MPVSLFLDMIELECDTVDAIVPGDSRYSGAHYPYPDLRPTGRRQSMALRTAVLENKTCQIVICLDLGGRIMGWQDKPSGRWIIPMPQSITLDASGPRGLAWNHGIEWFGGQSPRLNALGPVEHQFMDPTEEVPDGGILMHELELGSGLSTHASVILAPEGGPKLSARVANRSFRCANFRAGMLVHAQNSAAFTSASSIAMTKHDGRGIWVGFAAGTVVECVQDAGSVSIAVTDSAYRLAPRDLVEWQVELRPLIGLNTVSAAGEAVALAVSDGFSAAATQQIPSAKIVVFGSTASVEAICDLTPDAPFVVEANPLTEPMEAIRVDDADGHTLVWWRASGNYPPLPKLVTSPRSPEREAWIDSMRQPTDWPAAERDPELRAAALVQRAYHSASHQQWAEAGEAVDAALGAQASDGLSWWLKAAIARRSADDETIAASLPNAHYLSPLEPTLRAEAFLSQPQTHTKDPNPLVGPIGQHPDAQLAALHALLEAGLWDDAVRWIDECLRHRDTPLMKAMLAWCYAAKSRMQAEAAQLAGDLASAPVEAPYPWRTYEVRAIRALADLFPNNPWLKQMAALSERLSGALVP